MSAEISFISQITKIKRRLVIRFIHRILLNASLILLSLSTIYFLLSLAGITDYRIQGIWYFVSIGISISSAIIIELITRNKLLNVLIDMDRRLQLQDRISTAYEYLILNKKTEFSDLLLNDAAAKLGQLNKQRLVPAEFSLKHLLVIILLGINIFLYSNHFIAPIFHSTHPELQMIANAGKLMKNYTINRMDNRAPQQSKPQSAYAKKLEQFSNTLNDSSKPIEQRLEALDGFLEEVQGEQTRLTNELAAKLDSATIKKSPIQKNPDLKNLSANQLEKLKRLINKTLNNQLSATLNSHIESLQELDGIEKLFARIIDDLKDGRSLSDDSAESIGHDRQASQSSETLETQAEGLKKPKPKGQNPGSSRSAAGRTDRPDSEKMSDYGDEQDRMDPSEGVSDTAGTAKSLKDNQSSHEFEKTSGAAVQDKMASSQAKSYLIHIRALTAIGEARLKEEEIFQTYQQEIEGVLQKEDMPANYRAYIKNYFISIGLNTEDTIHEIK